MRHRQTKGPATDRPYLNHRATSLLYQPNHNSLPFHGLRSDCILVFGRLPILTTGSPGNMVKVSHLTCERNHELLLRANRRDWHRSVRLHAAFTLASAEIVTRHGLRNSVAKGFERRFSFLTPRDWRCPAAPTSSKPARASPRLARWWSRPVGCGGRGRRWCGRRGRGG